MMSSRRQRQRKRCTVRRKGGVGTRRRNRRRMTRGRRSGLTGFGGVRNEGGGGLRMGIRGKSRGGTEQDITIVDNFGESYKIWVDMIESDTYGAYIKIQSEDPTESKELIIHHTSSTNPEDLKKKIQYIWKILSVGYSATIIRVANILGTTQETAIFKAVDATNSTEVNLTIDGQLQKKTNKYYLKWYRTPLIMNELPKAFGTIKEGFQCDFCNNTFSNSSNFVHKLNDEDDSNIRIRLCGVCSVGNCQTCGTQLVPGFTTLEHQTHPVLPDNSVLPANHPVKTEYPSLKNIMVECPNSNCDSESSVVVFQKPHQVIQKIKQPTQPRDLFKTF